MNISITSKDLVFSHVYNLPIYANENTWKAIEKKDSRIPMDQKFIFNPYETKTIAGFDIESFNVSHDAIDPQFYIFNNNYKKFTMLTDTGYVSDRMKGMIRGSDAFMFESNHDVDMLRMCRYPGRQSNVSSVIWATFPTKMLVLQ